MSDMTDCPADGCDYRGTEKSVKGHWGGKQDDPHSGAYHRAKEAHAEASAEGGEGDKDTLEPREASFGSADDGDGGDGDTEHTLPCGHESFSDSDVPGTYFLATCETCGKRFHVDLNA